jgi:hypothetical protein
VQAYAARAHAAAATLVEVLGQPGVRASSRAPPAARRLGWPSGADLGTYAGARWRAALPRAHPTRACASSPAWPCPSAQRVGAGPVSAVVGGVRTLATTERRYNPMSYHNGFGVAAR